MGRFLRRTIPSPWNHSRRNCFAAPSGVFVHSIVIRSLLRSSVAALNVSHETAMRTLSFGSSTPHGGSTPRRLMLVVLIAHPIRRPPAFVLDMVSVLVVVGRVEDDLRARLSIDIARRN
uniref:Uncharacterized protein n=1 Tax=Parascaris univalens TaxID=6257 RepID=A0A915A5I2_PARUN